MDSSKRDRSPATPRLHLGSVKVPCEEWDPRVEVEPNFYYPQEDLLWSYCKRRGIGWNVVIPAAILGGTQDPLNLQRTALPGYFPTNTRQPFPMRP